MTNSHHLGNVDNDADGAWFFAVSSPEYLQKGWDKVRLNMGGPGVDGLTIPQFERNAASRILSLSRALRRGRYRPVAARRCYIPKSSGGVRPLDIPSVPDRIVQAAVALYLQPHFEAEFEDESFAYRPGRGVRDAVRQVSRLRREGFTHVVDADIRRYFENIDHDRLIFKLEEIIPDPQLIDLIWMWLEWYGPLGRGLPQGSPLSPALANLYLDALDENIAMRGVRLVRYADDFVLLCKSEATAERALDHVRQLLAEEGLAIHEDKTRITSFAQGFRFLGHVFVRSLAFEDTAMDETPQEDAIEAIKAALQADGEAEAQRIRAIDSDLEQHLVGSEPQDLSLSRHWRTFYVLEPKRRLTAEGESFVVYDHDTRLLGLAAARIGRIEVGKEALVDTDALDLAAAHDIPLMRLNGYGAPTATWVSTIDSHARRHRAQFAHSLDSKAAMITARAIVLARARSQWALLKRLYAKMANEDKAELAAHAPELKRLWRRIAFETDMQRLRGFEGRAAQIFWPLYARALPDGWSFPHRKRRPATGIGEVALNVFAGLLARDIEVAIRRTQLHPGIGFYHQPDDTEPSLVFDLIEEFRAPLIEACLAAAIGRGQVDTHMFRRSNSHGWYVTRMGYRCLVKAYEATINRQLKDPVTGQRTPWRGLFLNQALRFAQMVEGGAPYQPYEMDY